MRTVAPYTPLVTIGRSSVDDPGTEDGGGGAIFLAAYGSLTLSRSTIRDCRVDEEDGVGGAIYYGAGLKRVTIADSRLIGNDYNYWKL